MKLFTKDQWNKLLANGREQHEKAIQAEYGPVAEIDFYPVVKLFNPAGGATWLLSEVDHENLNDAFGLCDLGHGSPELGWVSLQELRELKLPMGLKIERDRSFVGIKPISEYADEAAKLGYIGV